VGIRPNEFMTSKNLDLVARIEKMEEVNPRYARDNASWYVAALLNLGNSPENLGLEKPVFVGNSEVYAFRTKTIQCYVCKVQNKYIPFKR
jgi:hypothetical protein